MVDAYKYQKLILAVVNWFNLILLFHLALQVQSPVDMTLYCIHFILTK
jgi:hypothetical protein